MPISKPSSTPVETIVAALIYVMTYHARTGCPELAGVVAQHMRRLAAHPDSQDVVRRLCDELHETWDDIACGDRRSQIRTH
jgi:hypothetical protein